MIEFLKELIKFFDQYQIPYMLSGSMAMSIHVVPRYTNDFDFVVHLKPSEVPLLTNYFKEGYYYDEDSVIEAVKLQGMFNIIDHKSNYKADFIILRNDEFEIIKFERRIPVTFFNTNIFVISAEDLLISKLHWIQILKSPLQSNDIIQLAALNNLDWNYIWSWVDKLKLNTFGLITR